MADYAAYRGDLTGGDFAARMTGGTYRSAEAERPWGRSARGNIGTHAQLRPREPEFWVQVFLGAALAALVGVFLTFLVAVPATTISTFSLSGGSAIPIAEIRKLSGADVRLSYFSADCAAMARALEADPRVDHARVERLFPNGLAFFVQDRKAVAVAFVSLGGRTVPAAIDRKGVAFADARTIDAGDLPVLSGVRFEDFHFGLTLPRGIVPMLESLACLSEESPGLLGMISEIRPIRRAYGEFDFIVYPVHYRMPVRTGAALSGPLLESIALVLDVVSDGNLAGRIDELDFRSGTIVYRTKEGVSG